MGGITYINLGSFYLAYIENGPLSSLSECVSKSVVNWKFMLILRRVVTFPTLFKYVLENQGLGKHYARIYFYEQRDSPLELLVYFRNERSVYLLNSNLPASRVLRRIVANPRFSGALVLVAELDDSGEELSRYDRLIRLANKLYSEVSRIVSSRNAGRVLAMKLSENEGAISVTVCVSREGARVRASSGGVQVDIIGVDQCFAQ